MNLIRVVSFDVTDTLLRPVVSVGRQYAEAGKKHLGVDYDGEALQRSFVKVYSQQRKLVPCFGALHGIRTCEWWFSVFSECMIVTGRDIAGKRNFDPPFSTTELRKAFDDVFVNFKWTLLPGAEDTLNGLKNLTSEKYGPMRLAAISNSDDRTSIILSELKILHYFDVVMTSVEAKCEKPDRKIFIAAFEKLNLPHLKNGQILHVGNSYHGDYLGASNLGMHSLLLQDGCKPGHQLSDESHAIIDIKQVLSFVEEYNLEHGSSV